MAGYLEVDPTILERNLLLQKDSAGVDDFEKFLRSPENYAKENASWKLLTPTAEELLIEPLLLQNQKSMLCWFGHVQGPPSTRRKVLSECPEEDDPTVVRGRVVQAGFCVKTTDSKNKKIFINVCKLDDIPEPRDITEAELLELWQSEEVPDYRIPLSIQEPHDEFDKSGNPTVAYDVALNSKFFQKVHSNKVFQSFVMQVILEGLENKYDIELKKEGFVILQNRKCLGELRPHRIRTDKNPRPPPKPLIEELPPSSGSGESKVDRKLARAAPEFRFFENKQSNHLIGEFHLPNVVSVRDVTLDVGENRVFVESRRGSYSADLFFPVRIDEAKTAAHFNVNTKVLTVRMPIISATA